MKITGAKVEFYIDSPTNAKGVWKLPTDASVRKVEEEYEAEVYMEQNGLHIIFGVHGHPFSLDELMDQALEAAKELRWTRSS